MKSLFFAIMIFMIANKISKFSLICLVYLFLYNSLILRVFFLGIQFTPHLLHFRKQSFWTGSFGFIRL